MDQRGAEVRQRGQQLQQLLVGRENRGQGTTPLVEKGLQTEFLGNKLMYPLTGGGGETKAIAPPLGAVDTIQTKNTF